MSTLVPPLFAALVDDAAAFPTGGWGPDPLAGLRDVVAGHRQHRDSWYAGLVGVLLAPASAVSELAALALAGERLPVGMIGDTGLDGLAVAVDLAGRDDRLRLRQVEVAVAKRGEDPQPGLRRLLELTEHWPSGTTAYAEIPLTWGLLGGLDTVAEARTAGIDVAVKFRTGGLAAELFPTPMELAAVLCACRDRDLPFKLTAGLHQAVRYTDPETGFTHHGFLNVLVASAIAVDGAEVAEVAEVLAATHPMPLIEPARSRRAGMRPLWIGFGSCSVMEPLTDLVRLGLIDAGTGEGAP